MSQTSNSGFCFFGKNNDQNIIMKISEQDQFPNEICKTLFMKIIKTDAQESYF